MRRRLLVAAAICLSIIVGGASHTTAASPDGHYQGFGDATGFRNILPPGQNDSLGAQPHITDQLSMYSNLVYSAPGLADNQIPGFFKDASFGVPQSDIDRVYSPTPDVTVIRDKSFGVPHIFGTTRYATMFAEGYTTAEDRLFLMDVLRHYGRAKLSEFLGATPSNEALDMEQLADAPYQESDLTAQLNALAASGPEGQAIVDDGQAYTDGVNQFITEALGTPSKMPVEYTLLGLTPAPWKAEDEVAIAAKIGAIFGKGGGGEVSNYCDLQALSTSVGSAVTARQIFDDFHFANDSEATTTSPDPAPYMTDLGPVDPAAIPAINCSSLGSIINNPPSMAAAANSPYNFGHPYMSNALLVSGAHTATGHPIAVFGPQTGYYMPQLLIEKDVHGPGIDARGAAFVGIDTYVQLGRGTDYAWSATSSGADNVDQFVLKLCDPLGGPATTSSMGYLHNGTCVPITSYQHTENTSPAISWHVEVTPDYGPISQRGTLMDGTPIAIANRRSTYGAELDSAHGFYRINNPADMTNGYSDFRTNMGTGIDYTFNWFYVDANNIGYQHSCKCPQRAQGVDPYLPAWGTGQWDWQGYIPLASQPSALNPAQGYLSSWNNKPAPDFTANDSEFSEGPVERVQMLNTRIEAAIAAGPLTRADLINAMEDGGTVDLRGQEVLPLLLQVMGPTAPGGSDPRAQDMHDRLAAWAAADAHRRDLDHNGAYDDPQAVAIMDAWWSPLVHAMFDASSGNAINTLGISIHDAPQNHQGSAFGGGMYSHVQKDLRQLLGDPVASPWSRTYCGGGNLAACSSALWSSLGQAAASLTSQFGSSNVVDWKRTIADDQIVSQQIGLAAAPSFEWINRPTFQQVVQLDPDDDNDGCRDNEELTLNPASDPHNQWDFYSVPSPALRLGYTGQTRDDVVGVTSDVLALLQYVGLDSSSVDYNADLDGNAVADGLQYDRTLITGQPARSGPPDGAIGITSDVLAMLAQSGHTCG
ncbi:MAG TPA: penicillin acylase family protein [Dehalococcoidia bacterium]|nr:penicillin acylase family protein [Dehalococcoidia bacterium]